MYEKTLTSEEKLNKLIDDLRKNATENEWIEFKVNNANPETIGEYISALSNSATINDQEYGYLVFGIEDGTTQVAGTTFNPSKPVKTNQDLKNYLTTLLDPQINFDFIEGTYKSSRKVVVVKIEHAVNFPVKFKGTAYVRVGSAKKPLAKHPAKERTLWTKLSTLDFESSPASELSTLDDALSGINHTEIFKLIRQPMPEHKGPLQEKLIELGILKKAEGLFSVTNLGAILFAYDLTKYEWLSRKSIRLIRYNGSSKTSQSTEIEGKKGYALGIPGLITYIMDYTKAPDKIEGAIRTGGDIYPEVAIRELVVNSLVHQDLSIKGSGPMIEIYSDRIEISNPGEPIIDIRRFLDHNPISRNEKLAKILRQMNYCEERGSGVDRAAISCQINGLPAPTFTKGPDFTRVIITGPRTFAEMSKEDRLWSLYTHASIQYIAGKSTTNTSVRELFKIPDSNYPQASRIIRQAIDARYIKEKDSESTSKKIRVTSHTGSSLCNAHVTARGCALTPTGVEYDYSM